MYRKFISLILLTDVIKPRGKSTRFSLCIAFLFLLAATVNPCLAAEPAAPNAANKALIVDGFSNHDGTHTTVPNRGILEATERFPMPKDFQDETQAVLYPLSGENTSVLTTDFTMLFNGKDLTGWGYRTMKQEEIIFESFDGKNESKDGRFKVIDGILTINPNPGIEVIGTHFINLWTAKEYTGDFFLSIEFRATRNADSGIFLHGIQLQCRDYLVAGPYKNLKNYKAQDWNTIEVVVKDNVARCTCNGEILEEALKLPANGAIGLEADRGQMEYQNIKIKELK
jgi:hypothetical protein